MNFSAISFARPGDAGDADAVVAGGADGARDMGAVVVIVPRVTAHLEGVESVGARGARDRLAAHHDRERRRSGPEIRDEIGVRVVDSGVEDRHHGRRGIGGQIPGRRRSDVGPRRAGGRAVHDLSDVPKTPQLRPHRIVRLGERADDEVRLGVDDVPPGRQSRQQCRRSERARAHEHEPRTADRLDEVGVGILRQPVLPRQRGPIGKLDDGLARSHLASVDPLDRQATRASHLRRHGGRQEDDAGEREHGGDTERRQSHGASRRGRRVRLLTELARELRILARIREGGRP